MSKSISILDKEYLQWIRDLSSRYRNSQIKAAVKVNQEQLQFYWELGKEITLRDAENKYGKGFYASISKDLKNELPDAAGLSERNIRYAKRFYDLYQSFAQNLQQVAAKSQMEEQITDNLCDINLQQVAADFTALFSIPWGHHLLLIDKCSNDPQKALFFVRQTVENGWSRAMLLNWIDTDLYERNGKAISNFKRALPEQTSDLAQEITKDPYNFAFTGITHKYNEQQLKQSLLRNITDFLIELGTGFAYVGREYRLQIGTKEKFIDLLFYHLNLRCYVVVEVKVDEFDSRDIGQLGTYVVACNHLLKRPEDNPTIGLLICKSKDNLLAKYALESSNQPLGISEFELSKLYPKEVEGSIPTIEEIEGKLKDTKDEE